MGTLFKCLVGAALFVGLFRTTREVVREMERQCAAGAPSSEEG